MRSPRVLVLGMWTGMAAACLTGSGLWKDEWYSQQFILLQDWEKKIYARLSPEGRVEFQRIFWDSRDEDSQLEYWTRLEHVRTVYKTESAHQPWNTDRARVYLLNGPPQEISFQSIVGISPLSRSEPGYEDATGSAGEVWSYYYRHRFVRYFFSGRRLIQQVYLNPAVREMEKESREVLFGITVDAESYRSDLLALVGKSK